ncbi:MAG: hypothetical protein KTR26_18285 [Flammeovirgaceae bacterium]|nr:hypothetical protein [Flammeovirgaceae bacterium]
MQQEFTVTNKAAREEIIASIDSNYTKVMLEKGFLPTAVVFWETHQSLLKKEDFRDEVLRQLKRFKNKEKLTKYGIGLICGSVFYSKEVFLAFRDHISDDIRLLLDALLWEPSLDAEYIKNEFQIEVLNKKPSWVDKNNVLESRFYLFYASHSYDYESFSGYNYTTKLHLPEMIQVVMRQYYPKPAEASFIPLDKPEPTDYTFSGEQVILSEMPRLILFDKQGSIKLTNSGKVTVSSAKRMRKSLQIQEFYPDDKQLGWIRAWLVSTLFASGKLPKNQNQFHELINYIFNNQYLINYSQCLHLLYDLKGNHNLHWYEKKLGEFYLELLKELPEGKWISYANIEFFIKYNYFNVAALNEQNAKHYLYYSEKTDYGYSEKFYINSATYKPMVKDTILKGSLFSFAAMGLLDVAYNQIDTTTFGKTYFSSYDGLAFVRLTPLGAYVAGKSKIYNPPKINEDDQFILAEDTLMIISKNEKLQGNSEIILAAFAERVSSSRYKVSFSSFMKDCKGIKDINNKIGLFKQIISQELPQNWKEFFKEINNKSTPFTSIGESKILKINENDRELIQLIARDEVLKSLVIKAEGLHVIIKKANYTKFRARLKIFGYIW